MITGSKIILREKRLEDARDDYAWEVDPELAYLDAVPPNTSSFSQFLADYADELDDHVPSRRRFAVDTLDGRHIGNCSYYNISESQGEAELGIMIGNRDHWGKGYGSAAVITLLNHIFSQTNLRRVYLKTLKSNTRAQKCFQKCGFTPYGNWTKNKFHFVLMEIHRSQWQNGQAEW